MAVAVVAIEEGRETVRTLLGITRSIHAPRRLAVGPVAAEDIVMAITAVATTMVGGRGERRHLLTAQSRSQRARVDTIAADTGAGDSTEGVIRHTDDGPPGKRLLSCSI
jgi:hypothetical protein